jgi:hypothetical protein
MGGLCWRICDPVTEARAVGRDETWWRVLNTELRNIDTRFMGGHNERFIHRNVYRSVDTT